MIHFNHIAVVGVGLIGGSFALAARRAGLCDRLTGWDGGRSLDTALSSGVIDGVESSFDEGGECQADLIYLAAPIDGILDFIRHQGGLLKNGTIVTDAGSAKREICITAREVLPRQVRFIGGHPMAGSHNSGVEFASADLFVDAPYAVIAEESSAGSDEAPDEAFKSVLEIIRAIGARPVMMTAERHDALVARVSHAPQIVSTALAVAVSSHSKEARAVAGSGFADMTRLARSRWDVWEGICKANSIELAEALGEILTTIESLGSALRAGDWQYLQSAFQAANEFAENLDRQKADKS